MPSKARKFTLVKVSIFEKSEVLARLDRLESGRMKDREIRACADVEEEIDIGSQIFLCSFLIRGSCEEF